MKKILLITFLIIISLCSCASDDYDTRYSNSNRGPETYVSDEDLDNISSMLKLSSLNIDDEYIKTCDILQGYTDMIAAEYFKAYSKSEIPVAEEGYERYDAYFQYHRLSLEKVVEEVRNTAVSEGEVHIWLVYNMGYVIKTVSRCFAIDLCHKHGIELAPYLDFLLLTHPHEDHYDPLLTEEMMKLGKPVVSNFVDNDYLSKVPSELNLGDVKIKRVGGFHNTEDYVQMFCIDCGASAGNFTLMHIGDSNYFRYLFEKYEWPDIDLFIGPYSGGQAELDVIPYLNPTYSFVSHISEMRHGPTSGRWTWDQARARAERLNLSGASRFIVPLCGEHFVWNREKGIH